MAQLLGLKGIWSLLFLLIVTLRVSALHFYIDDNEEQCFYEELPKDTLVVGTFKAFQLNKETKAYVDNPQLGIYVSVKETFDNDHQVVGQRLGARGRFTFTAADGGEHRICFHPKASAGWFSGTSRLRMELDLAIGESSEIDSRRQDKVDSLVERVKELSRRVTDIRREQALERDREVNFRNESEKINSRAVRWSILQLIVLGLTGAWQLRHLQSFFVKQKIV